MAKKKVASRAAAQTAVKKKWAGHKTAAKSSTRKTIKSRGVSAAKAKPAKKARPKQRIAISHHREEDFKADGLRTYAKYRDCRRETPDVLRRISTFSSCPMM